MTDQIQERFYITTPIYYVNGVPHLGHAYTMVATDAFARWHKLMGDDVFFLTGTDEHGLKVAQAAEEQGLSPIDWVDKVSQGFVEAWSKLGIDYDDFIRTTQKRHYETVSAFMQTIYDNGYIYEGPYEGHYCIPCEAYYLESELLEGALCPIHQIEAKVMQESNYFFALSRLTEDLLSWYRDNPNVAIPESKRNEALGFIKGGLEDISITRTSLRWGVPVPWDPAHVFYVWCDALVNYATAIGFGVDQERFERWWPEVHHVLGKDILRFHLVWWPAMCMAAGVAPPKQLIVHGWLLVGGEKMAKSRGNKVDPLELVDSFGLDPVRYYLLRETPFGADGDFSYEGLIQRSNSELSNNYGNLLSRVVAVVVSKLGGVAPSSSRSSAIADEIVSLAKASADAWQRFMGHEAIEHAIEMIRKTNAYLEANEPWKMSASAELEQILGDALEVLRIVSILLYPAIPTTTEVVWSRIGMAGRVCEQRTSIALDWGGYPGGARLVKSEPLFPRLMLD